MPPVSPSPSLPERSESSVAPRSSQSEVGAKEGNHGGARAGSGRDKAPYKRKNVTLELPEPLLDQWDAHCAKHNLSRAESLAKWLKWKKPGKKKS
jgi:hypothetical protein